MDTTTTSAVPRLAVEGCRESGRPGRTGDGSDGYLVGSGSIPIPKNKRVGSRFRRERRFVFESGCFLIHREP